MTPIQVKRKEYRLKNHAKHLASCKAWHIKNRGKSTAQARAWYLKNQESVVLSKKNRAAIRHAFLSRWKLAAGCIDCGYNLNAAAMDFDHISGIKVISLAQARSSAWPTILHELEKCVVRCANCHRIKTHKGTI